MAQVLKRPAWLWLCIGIVVGFTLAGSLQQQPALATATDSTDDFIIATGIVGDVEGFFTLDGLTGELSGYVLHPQTKNFTITYKGNVAKDLKLEPGRKPRFLMVTGGGDLPPGGGMQFASCVIYVVEVNSGNMACYAMPFNRVNAVQTFPFTLLTSGPVRGQTRTP